MNQDTSSLVELRFGATSHWHLAHRETLASYTSELPAVADLAETVSHALAAPLGLPSLDQAIVPGDQVTLAVDPSLPAAGLVVGLVAKWLCERGTDPGNLQVVLASGDQALLLQMQQGLSQVMEEGESSVGPIAVSLHDPDDPQQIAYVAANEDSDPIYINRTLVDADVVIPLGCTRHAQTFDYLGAYSLFPLFSNRETQGEFFRLGRLEEPQGHASLRAWADQAAWWLGLLATVQIIPASNDGVAGVLAGLMEPVEAASQQLFERLWQTDLPQSDLVVALLDSSLPQQNWREVMRCLHAAKRFTRQGGSIVVCSELHGPIGRGLRRLGDVHASREAIARKLERDSCDDALPAAVVLEATADYHVYLASELGRSVVENMGMGAIETEDQLAHLISQHPSWSVLGSAQHRF